jgi:hypothetical protein
MEASYNYFPYYLDQLKMLLQAIPSFSHGGLISIETLFITEGKQKSALLAGKV